MCGAPTDSNQQKFVKLTFNKAKEQIRKTLSTMAQVEVIKPEPVVLEKKYDTLSDNPLEEVQVSCGECKIVVLLSFLKVHIKRHSMSMIQYIEKHGNPRAQIVKPVHHQCKICDKIILLCSEDIMKHVKSHQIPYTKYVSTFMKSTVPPRMQTLKMSFPKSKNVPSKQNISQARSPISIESDSDVEIEICAVKIQCKVCFKPFKMNKQLQAHMRRH